jgi:hypothetical protein
VDSEKLTDVTSGFGLSAAITVLLNTALAWAKDVHAPLKAFMKSLTDHDWTTQGIVDLLVFLGLGFVFMSTKVATRIDPSRLIGVLISSVAISCLGLALWYAFF